MERITTLKKEKTKRTFSKLKINPKDNMVKIFDNIIKFIYRDLKDVEDLSKFSEYLKFNNFSISNVEELSVRESDSIRNSFYTKDKKNFYQAYSLTIVDYNTKALNILTNTVDIAPRARRKIWPVRTFTTFQRICDIKYIYGMLKVLDIVYEYCVSNEEILSESFKDYSLYGINYTKEDVKKLVSLENIMGVVSTFRLTSKMMALIIDVILIKQASDYNILLMEQYSREIHSEVARAFETKRNIPLKIQKVMKSNKFIKDFSYVELDSDTDLSKFVLLEKEYLRIRGVFFTDKMDIKKAELRVRKLGKHKSLGLYYSTLRCLCVDITSPSSFLHEFGHHLDYTLEDRPLSLKFNFLPIIREYTQFYDSQRGESKYLRNKRKYFLTPTEIFARTFEMYLVNKELETSMLQAKENMSILNGYPDMDSRSLSMINSYFDAFNFNFKALIEEKIKNEIKDVVSKTIEDIQYKELKQISFF
ncbi:hypothetical protein [uncultured Clostridium sp.]|uniref:hypothetical protein n=1 Tax=uncultured Clostridium sp. TaxID=59620 RepID=UPI0028EBDECA|nr:hypothetical protein [uncultured Clostridium sp.]